MTKPPKLEKLKTEPCTLEELQAALVQLIELHNGLNSDLRAMQNSGQILSKQDAFMNIRYGL